MRRFGAIRNGLAVLVCLSVSLVFSANGQDDGEFRGLLEQGFALHQQAKYVEAIPLLEKARRLEPNDYFANLLLGIDLLRTGRAAAASGFLQTAARANPDEDTPEEYIGEAEASLGNFMRAAAAYMEALRRGKNSEDSLLAWAGFALERFRQIGEELRSSDAGVAAVRRLQAEAAKPVASLKCSAPIPLLETRLAGSRANAAAGTQTRHELSLCYALAANQAAAQLNTGAKDQAALHRLRGDVLLRLSNDTTSALAEYNQAIAIRPNDPALYERVAEAQMSAGDADAARRSASTALGIDPHRLGAMRTLAVLAMNDREYDKAVPWLEKMKAESPHDHNVQMELGKALAQTGRPAEALENLQAALAAGYPDEKGALHSLEARLMRQLGRDAEAVKASAEAKRLSDAFQSRRRNDSTGSSNVDQ
jgi:tetratricopeptide (TPR) repeat protein